MNTNTAAKSPAATVRHVTLVATEDGPDNFWVQMYVSGEGFAMVEKLAENHVSAENVARAMARITNDLVAGFLPTGGTMDVIGLDGTTHHYAATA